MLQSMRLQRVRHAVTSARIADAGGSQFGNGTFDTIDTRELL